MVTLLQYVQKMHGMNNLKFVNAKQARNIYEYSNIKRRLHKTIAAIWFNKTCREKEIKPDYIYIKINGNNKQCHNTMKAALHTRVNQEIKFLYVKKQQLNTQLYRLHLKCANYWNNTWAYIQDSIERKIQDETEELYKKLNKKIDNLMKGKDTRTKRSHSHQQHKFYKRAVNLTNIVFMKEELETLDLGLQHSTRKPLKKYWLNLITETENAIKLLEQKQQNAYRILATKKN